MSELTFHSMKTVSNEMNERLNVLQSMNYKYHLHDIDSKQWSELVKGGHSSFVSDVQLAHFANDTYNDAPGCQKSSVEGIKWIHVGHNHDSNDINANYGSDIIPKQRPDLLVRVFQHTTNSNQIVFAFRGTKSDLIANVWHDIKLSAKLHDNIKQWGNPDIYDIIAKEIINKLDMMKIDIKHAQIAFTGHSLGATLAEITYYRLIEMNPLFYNAIQRVVLFDSPGVEPSFYRKIDFGGEEQKYTLNPKKTKLIRKYFMTPNFINTLYEHFGNGEFYIIHPALYDVYGVIQLTELKEILLQLKSGNIDISTYLNIVFKYEKEFTLKAHSMSMFNVAFQRSNKPYLIAKIESWPDQKSFLKMYQKLTNYRLSAYNTNPVIVTNRNILPSILKPPQLFSKRTDNFNGNNVNKDAIVILRSQVFPTGTNIEVQAMDLRHGTQFVYKTHDSNHSLYGHPPQMNKHKQVAIDNLYQQRKSIERNKFEQDKFNHNNHVDKQNQALQNEYEQKLKDISKDIELKNMQREQEIERIVQSSAMTSFSRAIVVHGKDLLDGRIDLITFCKNIVCDTGCGYLFGLLIALAIRRNAPKQVMGLTQISFIFTTIFFEWKQYDFNVYKLKLAIQESQIFTIGTMSRIGITMLSSWGLSTLLNKNKSNLNLDWYWIALIQGALTGCVELMSYRVWNMLWSTYQSGNLFAK
eukprot:711_1